MRGAPVNNGTPGAFISVLKAVLIDGFGSATVISATINNGVCKLLLNSTDVFQADKVILVSGSNVPSINGEQWATKVTATSLEFKTMEGDQTLLGTITVKYAPVGSWFAPFTGTNLIALKTSAQNAGEVNFRLDDTQAKHTTIRMYAQMSDINNGEMMVPFKQDDALFFFKSYYANTTSYPWFVVADGKTIHLSFAYYISDPLDSTFFNQHWYNFSLGYYNSEGYTSKTNAYINAFKNIHIANNSYPYYAGSYASDTFTSSNDYIDEFVIFYNKLQNSYYTNAAKFSRMNTGVTANYSANNIVNTNLINRKLLVSDLVIKSNGFIIGNVPGIKHILTTIDDRVTPIGSIIDGTGDLFGRKYLQLGTGNTSSNYKLFHRPSSYSSYSGIGLVDITGPW